MGRFSNKTVLITGGGRCVLSNGMAGSIGYGIAIAFAKEGANIAITGRNFQKLTDAKEELQQLFGVQVLPIQADISLGSDNAGCAKNTVAQIAEKFGGLDVLINNAQASASGISLIQHTTEQFDLAIYSGLYSTFHYMQAAYPYLATAQGSVINFASGAGLFGNPGQCSYAAAKEGIRALSRVAAKEWGADNINVNVICPLAWTAKLEEFQKVSPDAFEKNVFTPPMNRFADPELDIGRVCLQLASPDFKYLTGETLTLQGGTGLRP